MKLYIVMIATILSAVGSPIYGQSLEIFGYFEPQYMGVQYEDEYSQLFSNKLRVDMQSDLDEVKFAANFDYITYGGRRDWDLMQYIPETIRQTVDSSQLDYFTYDYDDTIYLDNAYMKFTKSIFDITLGKQQISPGTGYAWNPTDLFNSKDAIDPTYEQPGHSAIRVDAAIAPKFNTVLIYFPEDDWNNSGKLVRLKSGISHFDFSLIYSEKQWNLGDYINDMPVNDIRHMYGGDIVGELLGLGVWAEFGYNTLSGVDDFKEILAGADYTFDNELYVMAEYYRNGLGKSEYEEYDLNDWLRFLTGEIRTISRDNLYLYLDYPVTDYIHLSNSFITSLSDRSISLVPSMNYSMYQNIEMDLFLNFNLGEDSKAYSVEQGYSGVLRFKVFF